jgi:hypothetical protein
LLTFKKELTGRKDIEMKRSLIFLFSVALLSSVPLCRAQTQTGQWQLIDTKREIVPDTSYTPAVWKAGGNTSVAAYKRWRSPNAGKDEPDAIISSTFEWQGIPGAFKQNEPITLRVSLNQLINNRTGYGSWIKIYYSEVGGNEADGPDVSLGWRDGGVSRTAEATIKIFVSNLDNPLRVDNPVRIRVLCSVGHDTYNVLYFYKYNKGEIKPPPPPAGNERVLFDSMNGYGVGNGPTAPATFTIGQPHVLTSITTYHWNDGRGTQAGTIGLRDAAGQVFGPWAVAGSPGQGGVPNAFWTATPNVTLPAGTYTIIDSEPATWSQNSQSGNRGFSTVKSYPTSAVPSTKPPVNPINIGEDRLGREWSESENEYIGRWVRRGNSQIWDASWNNGAVAELSISIAGDKVTINRRDVAGPSIGLTSIYEGTLAPDGTMHGTETVTFAGNPTSSRFDWRARIVAP